jgi:cystathionine beta-lyase family protein involved in aluminum resistance
MSKKIFFQKRPNIIFDLRTLGISLLDNEKIVFVEPKEKKVEEEENIEVEGGIIKFPTSKTKVEKVEKVKISDKLELTEIGKKKIILNIDENKLSSKKYGKINAYYRTDELRSLADAIYSELLKIGKRITINRSATKEILEPALRRILEENKELIKIVNRPEIRSFVIYDDEEEKYSMIECKSCRN